MNFSLEIGPQTDLNTVPAVKDIYITTAASPQSKHDYEPDSYLGGSLFLEQQSIKGKLEFESNFSWE